MPGQQNPIYEKWRIEIAMNSRTSRSFRKAFRASPAILFEIVALNREVLVEFYAKVFGWPVKATPALLSFIFHRHHAP